MTNLEVGPVLRGLSATAAANRAVNRGADPAANPTVNPAANRAPSATVGDSPGQSQTVASLGPGGSFRYYDPKNGGDDAVASTISDRPPLILSTIESTAEISAVAEISSAWWAYVETNGAQPTVVELPDGAFWRCTAEAPTPFFGDRPTAEAIGAALTGRIAIVTGAAQGFGLQIAQGLASLGATVALADLNVDGARKRAQELGSPHAAFAVNVTDEESVCTLVENVVAEYGGFDLVVSNAGVLKAGSVKQLELKDFRFVTDVNYIGFFLMTKHTSPVLDLQSAAAGSLPSGARRYLTDIIEINSKSGLEGSNKNAAYAGSKFGGIGLVQSFALELVEQGTKVNAICPGNFLDGPLWSDPEKGLFVQYLRTGKVPGATTIEDVRRFYEAKVPMKRGCTGTDVVRAIAYIVGQQYETGQAVPVTGGQIMLS